MSFLVKVMIGHQGMGEFLAMQFHEVMADGDEKDIVHLIESMKKILLESEEAHGENHVKLHGNAKFSAETSRTLLANFLRTHVIKKDDPHWKLFYQMLRDRGERELLAIVSLY